MERNDWHQWFSSHDIPRPRHGLQPKANEYSWHGAWSVRFLMHSCEAKAGGLSLFSLQYHLQRLSKLIPFRQNAFSLSMSKESYSLQQRPTLFRLQSNLFLHLNDLPLSLQALQHLQCYIRLKLYCLKYSQGLHTLQNLQKVNIAGNLIEKIGRWYQSGISSMSILITTKDLCTWFNLSLILIKISYELAWFRVISNIHSPDHPKVCVKTP